LVFFQQNQEKKGRNLQLKGSRTLNHTRRRNQNPANSVDFLLSLSSAEQLVYTICAFLKRE
jgi:hypothetical protein